MTKMFLRFFTIADYEEEEQWLRQMHKSGWKLTKMTPPCFFTFESCTPQDVIYRLDYRNSTQSPEYMQMVSDFGWEYCAHCVGWLYFRKPADAADSEADGELFSDDASRADMIKHIIKTRYLPLCIIFIGGLCGNLSNIFRTMSLGIAGHIGGILFCMPFLIYVFLLTYCGTKLRRIKDKYQTK